MTQKVQATAKPDPAIYATAKIDLSVERLKMAERDGFKADDLDTVVNMKRGEYYDASITSYYHGHDEGYNAGLVSGLRARWPWWVWLAMGALALPLADKVIRLGVTIYNF